MKTTIGLEIHASITSIKEKLFSAGSNAIDLEHPNTQIDLLDLGLPGTLPVLNPDAVASAVRTCLALNMKIRKVFSFDRKSYFYPDLPLGYQITQFYEPIGTDGYLPIYVDQVKRNIKIRQLHMETDVGKSMHHDNYTLLDYNRCGSPLMEIVTQPDMSTAEEVISFIRMLRATLKNIGVSDASMELGNFRVDVNISISPNDELGTRAEIKNLNSYRSIRKAIEFEKERHAQILANGGTVKQETRSFDDKTGETIFMRSKEGNDDYMYFPDPDLPRFIIDDSFIIKQQNDTSNLPYVILENLHNRFGVHKNGMNIVEEPFISNFVRQSLEGCSIEEQKQMLKLMFGEIFARLKEDNFIRVSYLNFQKLARMILQHKPSSIVIKIILDEMWESDSDPYSIMQEKGLHQIGDSATILRHVRDVITQNPEELQRYLKGKKNLRAFFVGQVMKSIKADPVLLNTIVDEELSKELTKYEQSV